MRRLPSFVYGNVAGGLIAGIVGGAFLDLKAVVIFSGLPMVGGPQSTTSSARPIR